jgi:hypothetical protein
MNMKTKSNTPYTPITPMLLPWLAKKAGISDVLAQSLWRKAAQNAALHAEPGSAAYFKRAVDRLLEYVAAESLRKDAESFGLRPWMRSQNRFWATSLGLVEGGSLLTRRGIGYIDQWYQHGLRNPLFSAPRSWSSRSSPSIQ